MGALTEFLGSKVTLMQGLVGEKLGMISQTLVMLVATIFTMFYWGDWRVALVLTRTPTPTPTLTLTPSLTLTLTLARRVALVVLGCLPVTGVLMSVAMASMMPMVRLRVRVRVRVRVKG